MVGDSKMSLRVFPLDPAVVNAVFQKVDIDEVDVVLGVGK